MIDKAPDAYRTISEVAEDLDLPQHVLRFWETRFGQIKPLKRGGGRRYYRPDDVELLSGIRHLLYSEGYTIKGVQRILKEQGPKAVQAFARPLAAPEAHRPPAQPVRQEPAVAPFQQPRPVQPPVQPPPPVTVAMPPPPPPPPPVVAQPVVAPPVVQVTPPPTRELPPLEPAFPPERPYTLPVGTEQRSGTPVYMPEPEPPQLPEAATRSGGPAVPPTVSYMRGGLTRPPVELPSVPEVALPPQTFNVRRTIKPTLPDAMQPEPAAHRYSPLVEPDLATDLADVAPVVAHRAGLSDEARRSLQSALFELSECRRAIEITIVARDR